MKELKNSFKSSDNSEISSNSSISKESFSSKIQTSIDQPKFEDFSDDSYKNLFKNYEMNIYPANKYLKTHKRSLSEADQLRNIIQENPSSEEESPVLRSNRKGRFFNNKSFLKQAVVVNSSFQEKRTQDFSLINIVKNLAALEKKMENSNNNNRKLRQKKRKWRSKKTVGSIKSSKITLNYGNFCRETLPNDI